MPALRRALIRSFSALVLGLGLAVAVLLGARLAKVESSVVALIPSNLAPAGSPTGVITAAGRHLERYSVSFEVRGMNYYPKDYAWERFWIGYTAAITQIDAELDLARALGVNTVRLFVKYDLFDGSQPAYLDHLRDFVGRLQARNMVAIVTLFDLYDRLPYTDALRSQRHISAVVNTLGSTNPAILAWDIKNEPDRDYAKYGESTVKNWLREMITYTRQVDPNHLITIGFYGAVSGTLCYGPAVADTLVYSPAIAAEFAPLIDLMTVHYFLPERCFEQDLQSLQDQIGAKPVVLEEFGLHTCQACTDSHTESQQAAYYNTLLSLSEAHGAAGYLFWTLNDFSHILSGSMETHHCQGILRNSLVTTCQVATTLDYSEKPAADTIRRHYQAGVAYLDLFDGWVDPNTDEPPSGWSDNWGEGGGLLRGYNPSSSTAYLWWSRDPGKVTFSKSGISTTGQAFSPVLMDVNVDHYPFLVGQVFSYSVRDTQYGSNCRLHVGVKDGAQITRLLTITPGALLPYTFTCDLRQPPVGWHGVRSFQIALELVPEGATNGYSAAYELDWIGLIGYRIYLPLTLKRVLQ